MLPQHLVCKYQLNCEYYDITLARSKAPWWWSDKIETCLSVSKCFMWNYMCIRWLIKWSCVTVPSPAQELLKKASVRRLDGGHPTTGLPSGRLVTRWSSSLAQINCLFVNTFWGWIYLRRVGAAPRRTPGEDASGNLLHRGLCCTRGMALSLRRRHLQVNVRTSWHPYLGELK